MEQPRQLKKPMKYDGTCALCRTSLPAGTLDAWWWNKKIFCPSHTSMEILTTMTAGVRKCFHCKEPIVQKKCWNVHYCSDDCLQASMPVYTGYKTDTDGKPMKKMTDGSWEKDPSRW